MVPFGKWQHYQHMWNPCKPSEVGAEPMLNALDALQDTLGKPETLLADNGYFSNENIQAGVEQKIAPLLAPGREACHLPVEERLAVDAPEPETADPLVKMAWKLKTKSGRALYGKRKSTVEPVLGIIKPKFHLEK